MLLKGVLQIRNVGRLYIIQLGAVFTVWLASYFKGLDLVFFILYIAFMLMESITNRHKKWLVAFTAALIWQLPGIILTLLIITELNYLMPGGEYYIFAMELWYTPVIPLVSLISTPFLPHPAYYNILLMMPIILSTYYLLGYALPAGCVYFHNKMIRR